MPVKAILPRLVQLLQAVLETLTGHLVLVLQVDTALLQAFNLHSRFRNGCEPYLGMSRRNTSSAMVPKTPSPT